MKAENLYRTVIAAVVGLQAFGRRGLFGTGPKAGQCVFYGRAGGRSVTALGAPIELIPLLLAVDTIPDRFRTTANVTAQVAATIIIARPRVTYGN